MRLRLTVQRHGLPAANILWNVPDTNSPQAYTISRLLEDVNVVVPLEAEHWGLEHYVVEVAGFECLHFSSVAQSLKEDDHVSIRPLLTAEERARTLTGRHQISSDGRHLVDGVPFGRPYLRQADRPAVRIPPLKRRRLNDDENQEDEEEEEDDAAAGLLTQAGFLNPRETSAEAELFAEFDVTPEEEEPLRLLFAGKTNDYVRKYGAEYIEALRTIDEEAWKSRGIGRLTNGGEVDELEDSEEDDEDFAPGELDDEEVTSGEEDSDSDASSSSSDSDKSSSASDSDDTSSDSDSDSDSSSDSDSDSDSDASAPPEVRSSKGDPKLVNGAALPTQKFVPPNEGRKTTKTRNSRRTRTNRLRFLKKAGKLSENANLKDLAAYEAGNDQAASEEASAASQFRTFEGKRKRLEEEDDDATELEKRKQELMARFGEDMPVGSPQQPVAAQDTSAQETTPQKRALDNDQPAKEETPKKRLRPDTSAISRILARQAMPSKKASKAKSKPAEEEPPEPEGASDPDFWKSRLNVSAFECWEEEFELSAPPYPFKQHWDPASKLMREKADKKKKKRKPRESVPVEQSEDEEEKIILDYGDSPAQPEMEISTAIEDQLRQDVATATHADLPDLPEDMSTLPELASADIKQGAVIVCKFFTVNPVTITPEISDFRTAIVEREGDSGYGAGTIRLRIAERDMPQKQKKFDKKGNRIFDAADNLFMADEEDEGLWEGQFSELLEAKLLKGV